MNIVLHASYFAPNFGDVLLWNAGVEAVSSAGSPSIYYVNVPERFRVNYSHPAIVGKWAGERIDRFVFLGGGYFYQPGVATYRWGVRNLLRHRSAFKLASKATKVGIFGVGVGSVDFPPLRSRIKKVISVSEKVSVRDVESLSAVNNIYERTDSVEMATDHAFAYVVDRYLPMYDDFDRRYLSLHIELSGHDDFSRGEILKLISTLCSRFDGPIQLLIDCKTKNTNAELKLLMEAVGKKVDRVVYYEESLTDFMDALALSAAVVTTKLHVGICAVALKLKVIAIPKHPKVERFYRQAGLEGVCFSPLRLNEVARDLDIEVVSDANHQALYESSKGSIDQVIEFAK